MIISIISIRNMEETNSLQQSCSPLPDSIFLMHSSLPEIEEMRSKMIQSQKASVPETQGAEWPLLGARTAPSPVLSSHWTSQGPGFGLATGLGVWKPMKHGFIWAAQTQHLPGFWHLSSAALILVNIWLAHPGEGWGLFAHIPTSPVLGR